MIVRTKKQNIEILVYNFLIKSIIFILLWLPHTLQAQNWECIGPFGIPNGTNNAKGAGQITKIWQSTNNKNFILAGAKCSGLWKTTDGGKIWKCLTDSISGGGARFSVNPKNENEIFITSGISVIRGSRLRKGYSGSGLWHTQNRGKSWEKLNTNSSFDNDFFADIFVSGCFFRKIEAISNKAYYLSTDKGKHFKRFKFPLNRKKEVYELLSNPKMGKFSFAFGRSVLFKINNKNGEIENITNLICDTAKRNRISCTVKGKTLFALVAENKNIHNKLFKSDDYGKSWAKVSENILNVQQYISSIYISPDEQKMYIAGIYLYKSRTPDFQKFSPIQGIAHPDVRIIYFPDKENSNILYCGNDGGLQKSENGGNSWENITGNLAASLVIGFDISEDSTTLVVAGLCDCGSVIWQNNRWKIFFGGDGGTCLFDYTAPKKFWFTCNGNVLEGNLNPENGKLTTKPGLNILPFYDPVFIQNRKTHSQMFIGIYGVRKINLKKHRVETQLNISELDKINGSGQITAIAQSEINSDLVMFANTYFNTKKAKKPQLWLNLDNLSTKKVKNIGLNLPFSDTSNFTISAIKIHPKQNGKIWISGYTEKTTFLFETKNLGNSWKNISSNLSKITVNCLYYNPEKEILFAGTNEGLFYRKENKNNWILFKKLPKMVVSEIKFAKKTGKLYLATYGRGIWRINLKDLDL